ncbi:DNA methylase N-4/N-6 domain-containing protein [groundwater metagenome]
MANNKKQVNEELGSYVQETPQLEPERITKLPEQTDFYKVPRRFGSIPVDDLPLGCDKKEQYYKIYPRISPPFQKVERISFGHPELEPNRLFFGDNLHVMRMLPSESIDLIYIDPPFFSGRNYNVIFGDANEVRSFTDIWEDGMPGYLMWLNARLLEMKRLLKPTGSILQGVYMCILTGMQRIMLRSRWIRYLGMIIS